MNKFKDKIFNVILGGPLKFVTNENRNKAVRVTVFAIITVLCFVVMFGLLYVATKFKSIFVWVLLISCSLVLLEATFTFMKRFMLASGYKVREFDNEKN